MKRILSYIIMTVLVMALSCASSAAYAQDVQKGGVEADVAPITVSVSGSTLVVKNADQKTLEIYDVAGNKVLVIKVEGQNKQIDISELQRGLFYIVKVGSTTRKVYLK